MTEPTITPPSRFGPAVLLTLSVIGLVAMPLLMLMLALSTAQSYAVAGARASALTIVVFCLVTLGVEIVTLVRRRRAFLSTGVVTAAVVVTSITTLLWILFWLSVVRGLGMFS